MTPTPARLVLLLVLLVAAVMLAAYIFNHYNPWLAFGVLPGVLLALYLLRRPRR